jgi:DNA repair protein RecO (recombination protein O)
LSAISTPAVIVRVQPVREADLIVVLCTPTLGKLECIARGARRSRRRFPGGLPVGARGEASVELGRGALTPLAGFSPTSDHAELGRDLELFAYVAYLCELSDQLVFGAAAADPTSFARLCDAIATACEARSPALLRRYELGLLDGLGLAPALDRCSVCGAAVDEQPSGVAFARDRGGALCLVHGRAAGRIPASVLSLAAALIDSREALAAADAYAAADLETRRALRDLCRELITPQLRGPLRSLGFLAQVNRLERRPKAG